MQNDGGLDDLFGGLDDREPGPDKEAQPSSPEEPAVADSAEPRRPDASELNAAFIAAATEPEEPPAEAPIAPASPAESAAPPMTRRELRERRRAQEETGQAPIVAPAETPSDAEFYPETIHVAAAAPDADAASVAPDAVSPEDAVEPEPFVHEPVAEDPVGDEPVVDEPLVDEPFVHGPVLDEPAVDEPVVDSPVVDEPFVRDSARAEQIVSTGPRQESGAGFPMRLEPPSGGRRRRSLRWLAWFIPLILVLGGIGAAGWWVWTNYEDQVREALGWEIPNDFEGTGNGQEVIVTILPGDFGNDVAIALHAAGVTKSFDAFHGLLLELGAEGEEPSFQPGNYRLEEEMSARSALDALLDPANRITNRVVVPEGSNFIQTLTILSQQTGIPMEDFWTQNAERAKFGVPAEAPSLEGYLFPAAYDLDGTETAESLVQRLVTETFTRLDALGVDPANRHAVLTLASIVQRESGPNPDDPPKIAAVFQNRIDSGMRLEADATVSYGTCVWGPLAGLTPPDTCGSVFINQSDIDDTSNPFNTRANPGLPIGPIGAPGQASLEAVVHPAEGPWLFYVTVNLATGETVFTETIEQHEAAVERLYEWCDASDENAAYCT